MAGLCARALEASIEEDYVRGLIQKRGLVPESSPVEVEAWPWPIKIFTLGRFEVLRDGEPMRFGRKVQRKPLALLKALIAFGGRSVREELVMDALWPDAEGDAARVALASALHRLRSLLGREQAVVRQEGQLSLDGRRAGWTSGRWSACWDARRPRPIPRSSRGEPPASTGAGSSTSGRSSCPKPRRWPESSPSPAPAAHARRTAVRAGESAGGRGLVRRSAPRGRVCRGRLPEPHDCLPPARALRRRRGCLSALPNRSRRPGDLAPSAETQKLFETLSGR